jgi:ATP-dependent Zn protease
LVANRRGVSRQREGADTDRLEEEFPMDRGHRALRERFPLTKKVGRFLAYCTVIRDCRSYPQLRCGEPVSLVLIMPDDADVDDYKQAANLASLRSARSIWSGSNTATKIVVADETWSKGTKYPAGIDLLKEDRWVVLAADTAEVPAVVLAAADGIIDLAAPEPRHFIAACKVSLRLSASRQEANELASMPLAVISTMLRRGRPVSQSLERMRKAIEKPPSVEVRQLRIEDLHGLGEAGEWARELAIDLKDWRDGKIGWGDVDQGVLVSGPPGTGKTTVAKALATTCAVNLVVGSLARWQARGHLGDLLKAMRATFDEARRRAPCILFIDEVDALGDRETFRSENAQYNIEVVAGLLECLDGIEEREGVVVVGACNFPERLDAALVRPGRFDRHVRIPLPDADAREGIVRWHLENALVDENLSFIAARTEGWSGAALERLVRDARRLARRARRAIAIEDLSASLPPTIAVPEQMMHRTAVHEAGHVTVAIALGRLFESVEIRDVVEPTLPVQPLGGVLVDRRGLADTTAQSLLDEVCFLLGGIAAEEVILGSRSTGAGGTRGSDLHLATLTALRLETSYGLGQGLAFLSADGEGDLWRTLRVSPSVRERVEAILTEQMSRACSIVRRHRRGLDQVTMELLEKKKIGFASIAAMISNSELVTRSR